MAEVCTVLLFAQLVEGVFSVRKKRGFIVILINILIIIRFFILSSMAAVVRSFLSGHQHLNQFPQNNSYPIVSNIAYCILLYYLFHDLTKMTIIMLTTFDMSTTLLASCMALVVNACFSRHFTKLLSSK